MKEPLVAPSDPSREIVVESVVPPEGKPSGDGVENGNIARMSPRGLIFYIFCMHVFILLCLSLILGFGFFLALKGAPRFSRSSWPSCWRQRWSCPRKDRESLGRKWPGESSYRNVHRWVCDLTTCFFIIIRLLDFNFSFGCVIIFQEIIVK